MEEQALNLLKDFSRLLDQYGPEVFERLAEYLSTPDERDQFISVLRKLADAARQAGARTSTPSRNLRSPQSHPADMRELAQSEPEKAALLLRARQRLLDKAALPSLAALRAYALEAGFLPLEGKTRPAVVRCLLTYLQALSVARLEEAVARLESRTCQDDRSLAGWARIILQKVEPKKQAE